MSEWDRLRPVSGTREKPFLGHILLHGKSESVQLCLQLPEGGGPGGGPIAAGAGAGEQPSHRTHTSRYHAALIRVRQAAPRSVLGSHGRAVVKSLISTWVHAFEDRIVAAARPGGSIYCASSALPGTRRKCLKLPYGLLP
eukprot:COSAG02_NODE_11720_length_1668_cov_1.209688_1_plen_140_part_00